jgi:hypothetical protein
LIAEFSVAGDSGADLIMPSWHLLGAASDVRLDVLLLVSSYSNNKPATVCC